MSAFRLRPSLRKPLLRACEVVLLLYLCFAAYVGWAIDQTPETFGRVMAKMPGPVPFMIFPFETAWIDARAGRLQVGDAAPDFSLLSWTKQTASNSLPLPANAVQLC